MQFTAGLGEARGMRQASTAACSAATQRRGSTAASILIVSETLGVGVGALRFSHRDLALALALDAAFYPQAVAGLIGMLQPHRDAGEDVRQCALQGQTQNDCDNARG